MKYEAIKKFVKDNIRYEDWEFHVKRKGQTIHLQIQFMASDPNGTIFRHRQYCRKWQLSTHMTPSEIVRTCHLAVIQAQIHEISELFKYKGVAIFCNHRDVEELVKLTGEDRRL